MGTQLEAAREIIGAVAQPTWMVEMSGTIALINAAALSTLGYANADDLVGRNSHGTLHGRHVDGRPYDEAECPMVSKVVAPEPVQEGREWMTRSDESMIPVRWSSRHLMIDSLPMTMLTITDLSEGRSDVGTARRSRPSTDTEHRRRLFLPSPRTCSPGHTIPRQRLVDRELTVCHFATCRRSSPRTVRHPHITYVGAAWNWQRRNSPSTDVRAKPLHGPDSATGRRFDGPSG